MTYADCFVDEITTPIGSLSLVVDGLGRLVAIEFPGRPVVAEPSRTRCGQAKRQLAEYFRGERQDFDLSLAPRGTAFQQQVWSALRGIPYGETISYGDLAARIGKPAAQRAVGSANGANPIPIVIPCHRVIASNGTLGGYAGGLGMKRQLLELEGALGQGELRLSSVGG